MFSKDTSNRGLLRTAPPFRLRARTRPDGSLVFTHSGWQHAYLPILVGAICGAVLVLCVAAVATDASDVAESCGLLALAAIFLVATMASLVWVRRGLSSGLRLIINPASGACTIEELTIPRRAAGLHRGQLADAALAVHDLRVVARSNEHMRLGTFRGQLLTLKLGDQLFALAAARSAEQLDQAIHALPGPLARLRRIEGEPIHGVGDFAVV